MQFIRPGYGASFGADGRKSMVGCLEDRFQSDEISEELDADFPFFERVPDQSVIAGTNGERYETVPSLPVEMTICWFTITQDVLCRSI